MTVHGVTKSQTWLSDWTDLKDEFLFSYSILSDSSRCHGLQHASLPCPSPRACSKSCPLNWWCHPTISSSDAPFISCLQSFPASGSFLMSLRMGVPKNWYFGTVVLEKTLGGPLDCNGIRPVNPKGNQPWIFIGSTDAEAPIRWPPDAKNRLIKKDPDGLRINLEGWDGEGDGRKAQRGGYMYTYGWFMLRFDRKQQNSVKQLSFN